MVGTIVHTLGSMKFYGTEVLLDQEFEIEFSCDSNLEDLSFHTITRKCRREPESDLNSIGRKIFNSKNVSLGFIGSM